MNIKEVLEDIKRHLDYVNETNQASIRDNQIKVMYEEIERLNNIINELEKYLIKYSQDLEFRCYANTFLEKLQELKGDGRNE